MVRSRRADLSTIGPDTESMFSNSMATLAALLVFVGFNLTFFPQFILGYLGMPRRYHAYADEFQVLNVLSSAGASILGVGYTLIACYLIYSLFKGEAAGANPWLATGLEWKTESPPPPDNFAETPIVREGAYEYSKREIKVA